MSASVVTQWFSCMEKPVHVGEYQFRLKGTRFIGCRAYFNGMRFSCMTDPQVIDRAFGLNAAAKYYEWRGIPESHKG